MRKHEIYIEIGCEHVAAARYATYAKRVLENAIESAKLSYRADKYGVVFTLNDVRCVPFLFDLADSYGTK